MPLHPLQTEWDADLRGGDPLGFPGYGGAPERESVLTGRTARYALIEGRFDVLGGSMGAVHGERVVRAYRRAVYERLPMVVITESGGARMQEGMVSLIQMPRTAAAARRHADAGLLSVAIHRSPTTGGVFASYGSLADVRAAVTGATIGFAGPRVVEMTTGSRLPETSHTAESAYAAGLVDAVIDEDDQVEWLERVLGMRRVRPPLAATLAVPAVDAAPGAWGEVVRARDALRPSGLAWARALTDTWVDLHGGDPSIRGGLGHLAGSRVVVVAMDRFGGRPTPAGFRFARRLAALAGRLGLPLVSLVDTPGADPGPASEAGGIAGEIARTFTAFDRLRVPTVALCVGEGGSGGALALAHCDRLLLLEHAVFSVIAPEGAAAILLRDGSRAPELAEQLRLTAPELVEMGIADDVVPEHDVAVVARWLAESLRDARPGDRLRRVDVATARWLR